MTTRTVRPSGDGERTTPDHPRPSPVALLLILGIQLMVVLDVTVVNVALPALKDELGFSESGLSWVLNAYALSFGGLLLLGARLGDLLGRRTVLMAGIALFTLASLAGGIASDPQVLLLARGIQGVGAAVAAPQALALLTTAYPEGRERTRALGWYTGVSISGSAIGLLLGGVLTDWLSWRWVFFINLPVGLAILALAPAFLPDSARSRGHFDIAGAITSTLGMTTVVYGLVYAADHGWEQGRTIGALVLGAALMTAFVLIERRSGQPITPLSLFTDRNRLVAYAGRLFLAASMIGVFFFLTQFLQGVRGMSPSETGVAFLPLTAALMLASQLSARVLVERFGDKAVLASGVALSTVSMLWLAQIDASTDYWRILGSLVLFGIGNGTAFVPLTALGLSGVRPDHAGAASGLLNAVQQVGGSLGLAVLVTIYGSAVRDAEPTAATAALRHQEVLATGSAAAFGGAAVLLGAALVATIVGARARQPVG